MLHKKIVLSLALGAWIISTAGYGLAVNDPYHFNKLPVIGEPADRFLSPAEESKLGADFLRNVYRSGAVLQDPEISDYVQHLGNVLVSALHEGDLEYTLFVINDPSINAFAVPGGFIGINSGLILSSNTESELAGVIAHEIAHVSQRHIARRIADMSSQQLTSLAAIFAGILAAASGAGDSASALLYSGVAMQQQNMLNFTRSNEIEADRIGLSILYRAGYDPNGMANFFRVLQRQQVGRIPEQFQFLLTHPLDNFRINEAQNRIDQLPRQAHASSMSYHLVKARIAAMVSNNPKQYLRSLEQNLNKQKRPLNAVGQYAHSQALERNQQHRQALKVIDKLLDKDPENIHYQLAYARNKNNLQQSNAALAALNKMLAIYPDDFASNYYYAATLKSLGRATEGRDALKTYLRNHSAPTLEAYKLLAELHASSGDSIHSKQVMAEYYFNSGNYNAAIFQLKQALANPQVDVITRTQIERRLREMILITRS